MNLLVERIRQGDRRSLARAMSLVDDAGSDARDLEDWLRQSTGQVPWWGFTGPPGVGKSTLIDALLGNLGARGRRIGVVAVDPTSPVSGGALLGDRVRMMRHAVDQNVFIRSLATHHHAGGLSDAALHCARLLELADFDPVLIETVGVGQNEVEIGSVADVCVVVLGPGYGDGIQLSKAGLLEIADFVVVNKCELSGANRLLQQVHEELGRSALATGFPNRGQGVSLASEESSGSGTGRVEIVGVDAKSGKGVGELLEKLLDADRIVRGPDQRQRHRHRRVLGEIRRSALQGYEQALDRWLGGPGAKELVTRLERGELSLDEVVSQQLSAIRGERAGFEQEESTT